MLPKLRHLQHGLHLFELEVHLLQHRRLSFNDLLLAPVLQLRKPLVL